MEGNTEAQSNDQYVFCGPITIAEIKMSLALKKNQETIGSRASICVDKPSRTIYSNSPTSDYLIQKQYFGNPETDVDVSFISEYKSANATVSTPNRSTQNKDSFIEKVSEALKSDNSSIYASAAECSKSHEDVRSSTAYLKTKLSQERQCVEGEIDTISISSDDDQVVNELWEILDESTTSEAPSSIKNFRSSEVYVISDEDNSFENEVKIEAQAITDASLHEKNSPDVATSENKSDSSDLGENSVSNELDESSVSSVYRLNDTLEDIEEVLKNGIDYVTPEKCGSEPDTESSKSTNKYSETYLHLQPNISPLHSSDRNEIPNPNQRKCSPIAKLCKKNYIFKMPLTPVPAVRNKTPDCKNVVSPVAIYIKNSRAPMVQHVSTKHFGNKMLLPKEPTNKTVSNKENFQQDLPMRIYKPAKHTITTEEQKFKLPGNIQKHLPSISSVTKHTGRLGENLGNVMSVEDDFLPEDLTVRYSDSHSFDSSKSLQDVSSLTVKKTYIN